MKKSTNLKATLAYEAPACELLSASVSSCFCTSTGESFVVSGPWEGADGWE